MTSWCRPLYRPRLLRHLSGALPRWRAIAGMKRLGEAGGMTPDLGTCLGCRFPAEIISHAVWLYHLFSLSLRDVELILAERGITVTHESIRRWVLKFGTEFAARLRKRRPRPGDTWHLDEVLILSAKSATAWQ